MENEITNFTQETDVEGGWFITHWTKTWDTREALTSLQEKRNRIAAQIEQSQTELATIDATLVATGVKIVAEIIP